MKRTTLGPDDQPETVDSASIPTADRHTGRSCPHALADHAALGLSVLAAGRSSWPFRSRSPSA